MSDYVLKFAWRHYHLDVDIYDSLPEALKAAKYASDFGNEALERIEQIIDGNVAGIYLLDDVHRLVPDAPHEPSRPLPWRLEISVPVNGKTHWGEHDRYATEREALAAWGVIAEKIGTDRVRVKK